jgi:hypothetical protein
MPGKKVLISPQWIKRISWEEREVFTDLSRDAIKNAPRYDEKEILTRDYETNLFSYYKRQGYWTTEKTAQEYSRSGVR